jgi:outer membrane lipoprotein LolB
MRASWLAALLLVSACAQLQEGPAEKPVFELNGRLAARQGNETFSGGIAWRHATDSDEMLITTPMGQGAARIVRKGGAVVLTTAEPKEYRAPDAESLTEQALGFRLPLAGLADWVQGRASSSFPEGKSIKGPDGKLQRLEQGGWSIEYLEYSGERPSRLRLTYPGGIDLRLAISEWR